MMEKDMALEIVEIQHNPGNQYLNRKWQGIPGIEKTKRGTLWVTFYSGGEGKGPDNFVLLIKSVDDGRTWSPPVAVVDPPGKVRAFDPCLWHDPSGRLWWFWNQSYTFFDGRVGVWASVCEQPDKPDAKWSIPRRIANGVMMNKPTVLSTGEWLLPCAVWVYKKSDLNNIEEEQLSNVYCSNDGGQTFYRLGGANVEERQYDEHMIVERKDGSLWMLVRTKYGIGQSFSYDRGATWTPGENSGIGGPGSRFFIRRLRSGNLMIVNHYDFNGRNNLAARLSQDDGKTWIGHLMLDERSNVSYPDGIQDENGLIYVVYDRERYGAKEILMAKFTEESILKGNVTAKNTELRLIINKL